MEPKSENLSPRTLPDEAAETLGVQGQNEQIDRQPSPSQPLFSRVVSIPSSQHKLRRPFSFYLGIGQYDHQAVANSIRENGGFVSPLPALSRKSKIINLVDTYSKVPPNATAPAYKWTLIPDCIRRNSLLDFRLYQIFPKQLASHQKSRTPVRASGRLNHSSPTAQPITSTRTAATPTNLHDGNKSSPCVIDPECAHAGLPVKFPVGKGVAKTEREESQLPGGAKDLSQNVLLTSPPIPETDFAGQGLGPKHISRTRRSVDHTKPSPGEVTLSKSPSTPSHEVKRYLTRSYYQNKGIDQSGENNPSKSHVGEKCKSREAKKERPCGGDSSTHLKRGIGHTTREKPKSGEKIHLVENENDQLGSTRGGVAEKKQTEYEENVVILNGGDVKTGDQAINTNVRLTNLPKIRRTGLLDDCAASGYMQLQESPVDRSITNSNGAHVRNSHPFRSHRPRGMGRPRKRSPPVIAKIQSKGKRSSLLSTKRHFNDNNGVLNNNSDSGTGDPESQNDIEGKFKDRGSHNSTGELVHDNNEDVGTEIGAEECLVGNYQEPSKRYRVDHLLQRGRKLRCIDAVLRLVPQIPAERALVVVEAVRMVSKRANVSQNLAFRMLLRYEGKIEQATNAAKALSTRTVNNPSK